MAQRTTHNPCFDPHRNALGKLCSMAMAGTGFSPPAPTPRSILHLARHAAATHSIGHWLVQHSIALQSCWQRKDLTSYGTGCSVLLSLLCTGTAPGLEPLVAPHRTDGTPSPRRSPALLSPAGQRRHTLTAIFGSTCFASKAPPASACAGPPARHCTEKSATHSNADVCTASQDGVHWCGSATWAWMFSRSSHQVCTVEFLD